MRLNTNGSISLCKNSFKEHVYYCSRRKLDRENHLTELLIDHLNRMTDSMSKDRQ